MTDDETSRRAREISELCQSCGVCCDGTIFAWAELDLDMSPDVRRRLKIVDGEDTMRIPCGHLSGTRCGVYDIRPGACRGYECKQVLDHRAQGGEVAERRARLFALRALSHRLRELAQRELGPDAARTHWHLYRLLQSNPAELPPELALDIVELAVRVRRDLGWSPELPASKA